MRTRRARAALLAALLAGVIVCLPAGPAAAAEPAVQIQLGDEGSTPWQVGPISPGQSGNKTVTVKNTGTMPGRLSIWLSNVINTDGTPDEFEEHTSGDIGELGNFLTLGLTSSRLTSNMQFPAIIDDFPHSAADGSYIRVSPLNGGETVTLKWEWSLPSDAGNIVQGDSISFDIGYLLEELTTPTVTPGGGGSGGGGGGFGGGGFAGGGGMAPARPAPRSVEIKFLEETTKRGLSDDNKLLEPFIGSSADGSLTFTLAKGTSLISGDKEPPARIVFETYKESVATAASEYVVGDVYRISASASNGTAVDLAFSPRFQLVLNYTADDLRENTSGIYLSSYDEDNGTWQTMDAPDGYQAVPWQLAAAGSRVGTYAAIALVPPPPPPLEARIEVRNLTIVPATLQLGQSVAIKYEAVNSGWAAGERTLTLEVSDVFRETVTVKLAPGQRREFSYSLTPTGPGEYEVEVGGIKGSFDVVDDVQRARAFGIGLIPPLGTNGMSREWWTLLLGLVVLTLIAILLLGRRRNRRLATVAATASASGPTGLKASMPPITPAARQPSKSTAARPRLAAARPIEEKETKAPPPEAAPVRRKAASQKTEERPAPVKKATTAKRVNPGPAASALPGRKTAPAKAEAVNAKPSKPMATDRKTRKTVAPARKPETNRPVNPIVEAITGPNRRMKTPGPYSYEVKVVGGKPPYTVEWRGSGITRTVTDSMRVELSREQTWDSGKANWVFVVVKDSTGRYAEWVDEAGKSRRVFTYGVKRNGKVVTSPSGFLHPGPKS